MAKENNVDTERVELVPCEDVQPVLSKRAADKHAEEETSGSESAASSDLESDAEAKNNKSRATNWGTRKVTCQCAHL